ncbi:uncharacterized protein LOC143508669 [Brachyhypopomus gauderio]|uniref:uncharacterized protein LOC143508669 n=1 Tax=Brachyhypopomus gauderio TaxID=698409 RepID=UPI0040419D1F
MKTKELSKQVRDKVVEKYKSGLGYKKISKSLMIPQSTIKSIIIKWKEHGTTTNLPREGRPPKLSARSRRALIREAAQRPKVTLKELQSSQAETGVSVHMTTIIRTLHRAGLYGRVARKKPLLTGKNRKARFEFAKRHVGDSQTVWRKVLWKTLCLAQTQHISSPQEHHPHSETWWWKHHAVGMFFSSRDWKTGPSRGEDGWC